MRRVLTSCGRTVRAVLYGIDTAHAVRHGVRPTPLDPTN